MIEVYIFHGTMELRDRDYLLLYTCADMVATEHLKCG